MEDTFIPFTTTNKIRLQGRNSLPFYINIANPEVKEGYVPRIQITKGVYLEDALVLNNKGRALTNFI